MHTKIFYYFYMWICFFSAQIVYAEEKNNTDTETNIFGDWKIACPSPDPCRMAQSITTGDGSQVVLQMRVFKQEKPTALFSFPLGILLNTGWQIKIDGGKTELLPFEICKLDGCHAGIVLTNNLIKKMKRGNILKVTFFDSNQNAIEPKISLAGFTKAYETLQ